MARWRKGEEQVARLIEERHLQRVAADSETAAVLLVSAGPHVESPQFPGVPGLTSLDRLRRRRNQAEYPNPASYDPITVDEAKDAIETASGCVSSADRLLQLDELGVF
jgi:primosomal protein N'